jgi:HEAT repeat protein
MGCASKGAQHVSSPLDQLDPLSKEKHVLALAESGLCIHEDELIHFLSHDKDATIRGLAARGLGLIHTSKAKDALIHSMKKDPSGEVRATAVQCLITFPEKLPFLSLEGALKDKDPRVRENGSFLIGKMGGKEIIPLVAPLLADPAWRVRLSAAWALKRSQSNKARIPLEEALNKENELVVSSMIQDALAFLPKKDEGGEVQNQKISSPSHEPSNP